MSILGISLPCLDHIYILKASSPVYSKPGNLSFIFLVNGDVPFQSLPAIASVISFLICLKSLIKALRSFVTAASPLANGSSKFFLYQANCALPSFPLPNVLYNNPTKSSADGGMNRSSLPLFLPAFTPRLSLKTSSALTPVLFSIILLNVLLKSSDLTEELKEIFLVFSTSILSISTKASIFVFIFLILAPAFASIFKLVLLGGIEFFRATFLTCCPNEILPGI